jgi:UDP-N-acetylglucosamine 2-epimerase
MKIVTIVGARPQFIKASAVSRELRREHREVLVHTGQHYDFQMSGIFFDGLEMPEPDVNLNVGSAAHGAQTGAMLQGIEQVLQAEDPDWVVVFGDTNSTLAGALAAAKLELPIAHVEAGLRSFNRSMPEEINRVVADHLSGLLLCPSRTAVTNLAAEGITHHVHDVGDIMLEVLNWAKERAAAKETWCREELRLDEREYLVATVHRSENTDDPGRLSAIVEALNALSEPVVFPVHPRTRKSLAASGHVLRPNIRLIEPLGYVQMVALTASARLVLTDSGGLQKEAYWLGVPCLTLREETEWVETVQQGWNVLTGADPEQIIAAVRSFKPPASRSQLYGDGQVAAQCVELLQRTPRSTPKSRSEAARYEPSVAAVG